MSKGAFRVAYDGEALAAHTMDVRDIAPALLALGSIFVEANKILNGKETAVEVHVTPRIDEGCFDIGLEVLQSWGAIKEFLGLSDTVVAGELIDWILRVAGVIWYCLQYFPFLSSDQRGKPKNVIKFKDENGNDMVRLQFEEASDIILDARNWELCKNDKIRVNAGRVLSPVILREGISNFSAYQEGDKAGSLSVSKEEAREIDFTPSGPEIPDDEETHDKPFEAKLRVYSPVYDLGAPRWRFWYGKERLYMDVSESNIREVVL